MPQKKKTNKKKKGNRSAATCVQCARPVSKNDRIECICTRVIYCSHICKHKSLEGQGKHKCPGPPELVTNINQKMREHEGESFANASAKSEWQQEFQITILRPCQEYQRQIGGLQALAANPSVDKYAKAADQGHAPSAYMAGVNYKHRLLGEFKVKRGREIISDNTEAKKQLGVLTTEKLAFRYFSQAAEAGIGIAMQSLADCYDKGVGCEDDIRMCGTWLWRAVLQNSANAYSTLDSKSLIVREHTAQYENTEQIKHYVSQGQSFQLVGPNLSALILCLSDLIPRNYMLPAFASAVPTCTVGRRPARGTTGEVKIIGAQAMKSVVDEWNYLRRFHYVNATCTYGRRGTAKAATVQCQGEASRSLDSPLYTVPPSPSCDDTPNEEEICQWVELASLPPSLPVHCIHVEASGQQSPWLVCKKCITSALERMWAVAHGAVVLSNQEAIQARGQTAIFRGPDGKIKSENFKNYSRGDVECALAVLVIAKDHYRGLHCHPLFVAQDPNLFWPLIFYHGSIRAALEYVAPHVDWDDTIGGVRLCPEPSPLAKSGDVILSPGETVKKCGSDLCHNLEVIPKSFSYCGRCDRRAYCSKECSENDYPLHRIECKAASKGANREAMPPEPIQTKESRREREPDVDEQVMIHGLKSRPEFNGQLGRITNKRINDRFPVKVRSQEAPLLVKPSNMHRLGVDFVKNSSRKSKFKCSMHGSSLCSVCCVDFTTVNHLANLGRPISSEAIEIIADTHFAAVQFDWGDGGVMEGKLEPGLPMECQGIKKEARRFVLKSLLQLKADKSIVVAAAVAGMACYSGRGLAAARPYALPHLEALVELLND